MSENLPAGRELDAMIAEKVMGWKAVRTGWAGRCDVARELNAQGTARGMRTEECPKFSTDIEAAWEVVEKMRADGWAADLEADTLTTGGKSWNVCAFWQRFKRDDRVAMGAESMPLAVCKAALAAVGEP